MADVSGILPTSAILCELLVGRCATVDTRWGTFTWAVTPSCGLLMQTALQSPRRRALSGLEKALQDMMSTATYGCDLRAPQLSRYLDVAVPLIMNVRLWRRKVRQRRVKLILRCGAVRCGIVRRRIARRGTRRFNGTEPFRTARQKKTYREKPWSSCVFDISLRLVNG